MAVGAGKRVMGETSAALGGSLPRAPGTTEGQGQDSSPTLGLARVAPQPLLGPPEMPWLQRHRRLMGMLVAGEVKREAGRGRQAGIRKERENDRRRTDTSGGEGLQGSQGFKLQTSGPAVSMQEPRRP